MATFCGTDWFSSGPTRIVPASTESEILTRRFPGLDGEYHLDTGRAGARILQEGTLIAGTANALKTLINNLRSQVGVRGTLVDDFGFSYANGTLVSVKFSGSRRVDTQNQHYIDYTLEYRQALSSIA